MSVQNVKDQLKKAVSSLGTGLDWAGNHLAACLTIFSVVMGILFVREKKKAEGLETDISLKDKTDQVKEATTEVADAKKQEAVTGASYDDAIAQYRKEHGSENP